MAPSYWCDAISVSGQFDDSFAVGNIPDVSHIIFTPRRSQWFCGMARYSEYRRFVFFEVLNRVVFYYSRICRRITINIWEITYFIIFIHRFVAIVSFQAVFLKNIVFGDELCLSFFFLNMLVNFDVLVLVVRSHEWGGYIRSGLRINLCLLSNS